MIGCYFDPPMVDLKRSYEPILKKAVRKMSLGSVISKYRKELGITQESLAQQLEVTNQAVSKWESDQCCPDVMLLPRLADIFGITIDELFGRPAPEQPTQTVAGLPWEDDGCLRGVLYKGWKLVDHGKGPKLKLFFKQKVDEDVYSDFSVVCGDVAGSVNVGGYAQCGVIMGSVNAGGDVQCENIGCDVNSGGDVTCAGVGGNINTGGDVRCGNVGGGISTGGDVTCTSVGGNIETGGDVTCQGNVEGCVSAGGDVKCGNVGGNIETGCDVECHGSVGGYIEAGCDVSCQDVIAGYVEAGCDVTCRDVPNGYVSAGGDVKCGNVGGPIDAGGDVTIKK